MRALAPLPSPSSDLAPSAGLLRGYSVEVLARDLGAAEVCSASLPAGTEVYLSFPPGDSHHSTVPNAAKLRAAGFVPVPHIAARSLVGHTQLDDFLRRLAGEAGVTRALVIGGDVDRPAGPFHASLDVLRSGLLQRHGIREIGLAVHPEAHRRVGAAILDEAVVAKLDLLMRDGLRPWLVTQFCFEAAPILARIEHLRASGVTAPVRIGLAGPTDRRSLWKYALHCGIGASLRALGSQVDAVANLLAQEAPDALLAELAHARASHRRLRIEGVHFFTFGSVAATAAWANRILETSRSGAD